MITEDDYFPEPNSGCWIWMRALNSTGYPNTVHETGHRKAFKQWKGPIPEGLQIRHKCGNRVCINPDHLEPGTQAENEQDKKRHGTFRHDKPLKLVCKRGHPLRGPEADVYIRRDNGRPMCNECRRMRQR